MKKLVFLSATLMILVAANAQTGDVATQEKTVKQQEAAIRKQKREDKKELRKLEGKDVSYQAKQQFAFDFGDIKPVEWSRMEQYDRAVFTKDGKEYIAYYDADAQLIGTTTIKSFSDLPEAAQKYINKHYAGYTTQKVLFYDDNEYNDSDMILYGAQFADEDNYFVEMAKGDKKIVLQVNTEGEVFFFSDHA